MTGGFTPFPQGVGPDEPRGAASSARLVALRAWAFVGCAAVFVIVVLALGTISSALGCFLVAVIVGFICASITDRLERHGVGRALGAFLALVVVLIVAFGLLAWLGPLFVEQLSQLLSLVPSYLSRLPDVAHELWETYGPADSSTLQANVQGVLQGLSSVGSRMASDLAASLSSGIFPYLMGFANGLVMFFVGLVMAYWFAKDYPAILRELALIAGPRHSDDLALLISVLSRSMGGYMSGLVATSLVNGVLVVVGLTLVGHPYAGLVGILTALLHVIPVVGPMCSAAIATAIALFTSPLLALWSLVLCVVAQNITDNVVGPLVMRSAVKIHPAMSLMGITIGASLGGLLGMALAIPLTAAIKGAFIYYFESRTGRQLVSYEGAFFKGTPYHHDDGTPAPCVDAVDDERLPALVRLMGADAIGNVEAQQPPERVRSTLADRLRWHSRRHERADKRRDDSNTKTP